MAESVLDKITGLPESEIKEKPKAGAPPNALENLTGFNADEVIVTNRNSTRSPLDDRRQAIDLTNAYPDPIEKYAEYNVPLNPFVDWNETRAQNQGTGEKWVNGLTKAVITAGGAFAENTVGVVAGLGNMMFGNGSFYDNPVGQGIDSINEWAQRELPNYYTKAEQHGSLGSSLGTANFWADKVANGVGYTIGSIATMFVGTGEAALIGKMGNLGRAGKILSKVDDAGSLISPSRNAMYRTVKGINNGDSAADIAKVLQSGSRGAKIKSAAQHFTIGTQMSLAEGSVEARETKKRYIEEEVAKWEEANPDQEMPLEVMDKIVADGNTAGNIAFGINMAVLVPSNLMMFGKAIMGMEKVVSSSINPIKNIGAKAIPKWIDDIPDAATAKFFTKGYRLLQPIAKNMGAESFQEAGQFFGSEFARHYTASDDFAESVSQGLSKTFGTKEGQESILIGAIVGGGSGAVSRLFGAEKKLAKSKAENTTQLRELLNSGVVTDLISNMEQTAENIKFAAKMSEAMAANNSDLAELYRSRIIANEARRFKKVGALDYFYDQLEDVKSLPENEFIKRFGYDPTRTLKEQTGKTQSEILDDVASKTKLSAKRTEQVADILQSYVPSQTLIGKLFESFGATDTKLAKQMSAQVREFAARAVLTQLTDIDTLDNSIENSYAKIQKLAEDNPRLQRIASLITPDMVFKIKTGEITVDETGKKLVMKSGIEIEKVDKKLEKEINEINQSLLQTNPADSVAFSILLSSLSNNIARRETLISYANLLTTSQSELENYLLAQIKEKQVEDKERANQEADSITANAQTSQEIDENFPAAADPAKKAEARARRRQLVEEENRLTSEYTQLSEEDFGNINEEELPEINKLAYRRALRVREETKAKTLDARTISLAPEQGETADFITELTELEASTFEGITMIDDGPFFIINGRKYYIEFEDPIDAISTDLDGNPVAISLIDFATGERKIFSYTKPTDVLFSESREKDNAIIDAFAYVIGLKDNEIGSTETEESLNAKTDATIEDSVKILEFEKTEGDKLNNTPSQNIDQILEDTNSISGLSDTDLRVQIVILENEISSITNQISEWRKIGKEADFSERDLKKDPKIKDLNKLNTEYKKALKKRVKILAVRTANAKAAQADLTQGQIPEEIEQTISPEQATTAITRLQAEIDQFTNELSQLEEKIKNANALMNDPNFTPNTEFITGVKDVQSKSAALREKIERRKNTIENINAEKSNPSSPEGGPTEGVTPETEEQETPRTNFAPAEGVERTSDKGISDEEAERINKKNAEAAKVNTTVQKTPAQTGQNLSAQQSQNAEVVVQIQGDLDVQLSPIESKTVGVGKNTKRLVSPTGRAESGSTLYDLNIQELNITPSLLTDPNLPNDFVVTFEVREDLNFEFTDWTDVPIFVMVTNPSTGQQDRVGILQAGSKSREDIYNLYKQGLTPVANASKLFGSKNIANSRSDQSGTVYFYPATDIINAEQTVALAYVGETRAEGVRIVPIPIPGKNFNMALNLTGDFTPGQILAVVLNPDGVPVPIPLSTRDINEQVVNTVTSLIQSEDATDPSKVLEIVGFNSIPPAGLPDDFTGEIEADGVIEMTRDNRDFGMAYTTRSGNVVFIYYSPTANSYISINQSELSKALSGQKASFSFVVAEQTEKGIDLKTVSKQPAAYQVSGEVLADEFKAMLRTKKMQVSKERLANNSSFTSPISGIEYLSYYEYLSSETEVIEDRVDGNGSKAVLATDTPSVNDYGSVYYNLGLKFTNISTVEKPVAVEEDLAAKAVNDASANLNTATPITPATVSDKKADIIQTNKPNIQTVGNVTFGTANKQGQTDNNEDAVYVDAQNGVFILADGMGGEGMITLSPAQASKLVINKLLGNSEKNLNELLYEEYLKNPDITNDEVLEILQKNGINLTGASTTIPSKIVNAFRTREDISVKKGFRSGATALKAVKTGKNTYTIEKVGDTVFFVVDKNGKVTQQHGLSDVATTQGYMFSIKDGKPFNSTPKTDNFTITLNEGETLVLATDFIETDKAIQDFIDSNFGKNLDFDKFQKNNKVDDSTFITIKYDAELTTSQPVATVSTAAPIITSQPTSSEAIVGAEFYADIDDLSAETTISQNPEVPSMVTPAVENNSSAPTNDATADPLSLAKAKFAKQFSPESIAKGTAEAKAIANKESGIPNPDSIQDLGTIMQGLNNTDVVNPTDAEKRGKEAERNCGTTGKTPQ
jgi:serine/threonine protein phosphatase PrpC